MLYCQCFEGMEAMYFAAVVMLSKRNAAVAKQCTHRLCVKYTV